jgi:hypothetical protein
VQFYKHWYVGRIADAGSPAPARMPRNFNATLSQLVRAARAQRIHTGREAVSVRARDVSEPIGVSLSGFPPP